MSWRDPFKDRATLLLALAVAARQLLLPFLFPPFMEPDSGLYATLGRDLAAGAGFTSLIRLPGYPLFLSFFYSVFGPSNLPVIIFQYLLGGAVCFLILACLKERRERLIFLSLFLLDLLYAGYNGAILAETIFSFLLFASALQYRNYAATGKLYHLLACGALVAAGIFTKPVLKYFPALVVLLVLFGRGGLRQKAGAAAVFLFIPLLSAGLWSFRNYKAAGDFSLLPFESLHYGGRVLTYLEFPEGSRAGEVLRSRMAGLGTLTMRQRGDISVEAIGELKRSGMSEPEIDKELRQIYSLSLLRHPFIHATETAREWLRFFLSAHNLYAKRLLADLLPKSASDAIERRDLKALAAKALFSLHPLYWLLFLSTITFFLAGRSTVPDPGGLAGYGLALTLYISVLTSMANEGLANYRYPLLPFMLYFSALVLARLPELAARLKAGRN